MADKKTDSTVPTDEELDERAAELRKQANDLAAKINPGDRTFPIYSGTKKEQKSPRIHTDVKLRGRWENGKFIPEGEY